MIAEQYPGLRDLSDEAKLQLAGELWQDVVGDEMITDDGLTALMEERLAAYHASPDQVSSWDDVKARLLALRQ